VTTEQKTENGTPPVQVQTNPAPLAVTEGAAISAFASQGNFDAALRMAKLLAATTMLPAQYQNNLPNCMIAIEMASRIGASVMAVCQNLDIIHGRPGWRSTFLIATVNASHKFTPLRYRWQGNEGEDTWGCRAVARDKETNEECVGALITIALAKAEKWYDRQGSKWKTIPEQMLLYRAAAFWSRVYCPELSLGMQTADEVIDTTGMSIPDGSAWVPGNANTKALEDALMANNAPQPSTAHDADGVVIEPEKAPAPSVDTKPAQPAVTRKRAKQEPPTPPPEDNGRDDAGAEAALGQRDRIPGEDDV
jgi:hypothetical protein